MSESTDEIQAKPTHQAAKRKQSRKQQEFPDDFDERAKQNAQKVTKIHEFRRENIRELEEPKQDYFDYDPSEKRRYDALKIETLFKFQTTYKAIKWGVVVGSMFAFHRYFRTRDLNTAAHWFTVMSFVSFFNIWISYGLQEFVTEYGSRKSLSLAARNEYHTNAYKTYLDNLQTTVRPIDDKIQPVLHNSQGAALHEFIGNYDAFLKERFNTAQHTREEIISNLVKQSKLKSEDLTQSQIQQINLLQQDKYQRSISEQVKDNEQLKQFVEDILRKVDSVDLKSYEFDNDEDLNFKSIL